MMMMDERRRPRCWTGKAAAQPTISNRFCIKHLDFRLVEGLGLGLSSVGTMHPPPPFPYF